MGSISLLRLARIAMVFGGFAALCLLIAAPVQATHPRPKGATPVRISLVPAYAACSTPNRTHGPPLAFPSCNPPAQSSSYLTVGTPDANGAPAGFAGNIRLDVASSPSPPEDSEFRLEVRITDVRCKAGANACGNANAAGGPDYVGELQANATVRITDHWNATSPGGGPDPATVVDIPFPISLHCTSTSDPSTGGSCATQANAVQPGVPGTTTKRGVIGITQFQVFDGGADGMTSTTPNGLFAVQGIFVP